MCLAIPGQIVELIPGGLNRALVDVLGVRRGVDISLVEPEGIAPEIGCSSTSVLR
jgi:hydrogenase expression/formation protein HypC